MRQQWLVTTDSEPAKRDSLRQLMERYTETWRDRQPSVFYGLCERLCGSSTFSNSRSGPNYDGRYQPTTVIPTSYI